MILIVIDHWIDSRRQRQCCSRVCVKCDDCGAMSEPRYGDTEYDKAMAIAHAVVIQKWTTRLRGNLQQHVCPKHAVPVGQTLALPGMGS